MTDYYVDSNAAGPGSGTIGEPWDDIASNINSLSAGDTMYLRGGVTAQLYTESEIDITVNGTSTSLITITPYSDELVEIRKGAGGYMFDIHSDWIVIDGKNQLDLNKNHASGTCIYVREGADDCTIRDCTIRGARSVGAGGVRVSGHRLSIDGCTIYDMFNSNSLDCAGISHQKGEDLIVRDCTIFDCYGDCIIIDDSYTPGPFFIRDCTLYTTLAECAENAVDAKINGSAGATQSQIQNCTAYGFRACTGTCGGSGDPGGEAFSIHNSCDNVLIEGCLIYNCTSGIVIDDGVSDIIVRRCVIRDLVDSSTDTNASNLDAIMIRGMDIAIYNNTFDDCPEDSIHFLATLSNVVIKNNIFNDCNTITGSGLSGYTADYNCWYNCTDTLSGANDVTSDPDFVDEAGNDFELESTSPCIDEGLYENPVDYYFGSAPDMGAFEYTADLGGETIQVILWRSNGTGDGDDGDLMAKATVGAVTRVATLSDYSVL